MVEVLEDVKEQKLIQLEKWGYEYSKEAEDSKLIDFLLLHWEDTEKLAESVGNLKKGLFKYVLPAIKDYITEKNWPSIVKSIIELSTTEDADVWFCETFEFLRVIMNARTLLCALELPKIPNFYKYAKSIYNLPKEMISDIKSCLCPELVSILKSISYLPDVILLIPFMKVLVKLFLQKNIDMVYALDKSGRILGYLLHSVLSNMGLAKRAKFYFMNVKKGDYYPEPVLYSEKQEKELRGKNVLLIDESIVTGETIHFAQELLSSLAGRGRVTLAVFSDDMEKGRYHSITSTDPSWRCYNNSVGTERFDTVVSGVRETKEGFVKPVKEFFPIAQEVRLAFSKLAKIIAAYLKEDLVI